MAIGCCCTVNHEGVTEIRTAYDLSSAGTKLKDTAETKRLAFEGEDVRSRNNSSSVAKIDFRSSTRWIVNPRPLCDFTNEDSCLIETLEVETTSAEAPLC